MPSRLHLALLLTLVSMSVADAADVIFTPEMAGKGQRFELRADRSPVSRGPARLEGGAKSIRPATGRILKVVDPGENSPLDFDHGDTLTIEAWVRLEDKPSVAFPYIVGKGRTHTGKGATRDANQNYALRLAGNGKTNLSFLWMDVDGTDVSQSAHRWTSKAAVPFDGRWHHVVLTYTFGTAGEVFAAIDGESTSGIWDMKGNSAQTPVTDNDDLWVGASMGGGHLFPGQIDGLAIYRGTLTPSEVASRAEWVDQQVAELPWSANSLPLEHGETKAVVCDLPTRSWFNQPDHAERPFAVDGIALTRLPHRYTSRGVIGDRGSAAMLRVATTVTLPAGQYRILLRTLDAARVYRDDQLIAECESKPKLSGSAHNKVYELTPPPPGVVQAPAAHTDVIASFESDGEPARFEVYRLLGGDKRVQQLGEFLVAIAGEEGVFRVLGSEWQPNDSNWRHLLDREHEQLVKWNRAARLAASIAEQQYWDDRHQRAAQQAPKTVAIPEVVSDAVVFNEIDHFILANLDARGLSPTDVIDDAAFLRRVTLDCLGRGPTLDELVSLGQNLPSPPPLDRPAVIRRLVASHEWADRWAPYWIDVLAENPALTKPTLNNSGPFRYFIHDALVDNWGMDRFVTALVRMDGSRYTGGPSGFAMATQNDVPLAAKAHILGTAFLGLEMKCARCHDAPGHPFLQQDLFSVAAMLNRKPLKVPASSSIPATPEELAEMVVNVSIKPGESVAPAWPFPEIAEAPSTSHDTREQLALAITSPENTRFREVIVNRLWTALTGVGLVDSTEDWTDREPVNNDLLQYLARELLISGDDFKHVAQLIMNSAFYQRAAVSGISGSSFAAAELRGPVRRRLTAEQLVDSLHKAVGKPMRTEVQSFSPDGVQARDKFLELGRAARAWQLVSTSSERDRQSLALPAVDSLNELLQAYGWRPQRQEPHAREDVSPTPLTPMMLAHGSTAARLLDATPDAWLTNATVEADSPADLLTKIVLVTLGRQPTAAEKARFGPLLQPGFQTRLTGDSDPTRPLYRHRVTWRNHFDPKAEELVLARWSELENGFEPTRQLSPDYRQRAEDVMWVLINSPEFAWVP